MKTWLVSSVLAAVLAVGIHPAHAQQTAGNISGRVIDTQGAAVPGATVKANDARTGFTRTTTSDAEGLYRLTALPVATYDLTVSLSGFKTIERKGIILNVSQTI